MFSAFCFCDSAIISPTISSSTSCAIQQTHGSKCSASMRTCLCAIFSALGHLSQTTHHVRSHLKNHTRPRTGNADREDLRDRLRDTQQAEGKYHKQQTKEGESQHLTLRKFVFTNGQTLKNARNSNFLSSNGCFPNSWTRTMVTKATGCPTLVQRISSPFEDRLNSRIVQFLRTLVLFFVLLAGFEEWFYIPAGSLPYIRCVISRILFSLEQSRVVDLTVAEHHPDSILESNVLNLELSQLLLRRMQDCPRHFCQIA